MSILLKVDKFRYAAQINKIPPRSFGSNIHFDPTPSSEKLTIETIPIRRWNDVQR